MGIIINGTQRRKSGFVTFIGVLMVVFAAFGLLACIWQIMVVLPHSDFQKQMDNLSQSGFHRDWLNPDRLKSIAYGICLFSCIVDVLILWAAIALMQRKFWARTFFLVYFTFKIVIDLIVAGVLGISITIGKNLFESGSVSSMAKVLSISIVVVVGVNCLFYLFGFFMLSSKKIKREFQPSWMR